MSDAARTAELVEPLLRTTEVAALLGMSREQVWRLWSAGRLPGYKFDRHLRFAQRDVARFLSSHYSGSLLPSGNERDERPKGNSVAARATKYVRI